MKNLLVSGRRARIPALVFIVAPLMAAISLRAGEIHDAAAAGDSSKVKALLAADATLLESKGDLGFTPLLSACANQRVEVANVLLDKGADVKARDNFQMTPLHRASYSYVQAQDLALVQRLIDKGADVNAQGYNGLIPLHQAAQSGGVKLAQLLLANGADINSYDKYSGPIGSTGISGTVLQVAINFNPREEMATFLVEHGATLSRKDSSGNTELHLAALKGYADLTRRLVEHGADVNAVNEHGRTALYYAARHGYRRAAEALIAAGAKASGVGETNYGKAAQLTAPLRDGEAWLWSLGGGGYVVKTKGHLLAFDPDAIDDSPEAGLANGRLNPNELADQKITGLITIPERWWQYYPVAFDLVKRVPAVSSVVYPQPAAAGAGNRDLPSYRPAAPNAGLAVDGVRVHAIPALGGGVGYLVEADGVKILHAGLHVSSNEGPLLARYRKEIDFLKPFGPVDIAILSVSAHTNDIKNAYEPHLYLLDQLAPKAVYLIGANIPEQYVKCAAVLRARSIPITFPEQERTKGERSHYLRDRASAPTASAVKTQPETKP